MHAKKKVKKGHGIKWDKNSRFRGIYRKYGVRYQLLSFTNATANELSTSVFVF